MGIYEPVFNSEKKEIEVRSKAFNALMKSSAINTDLEKVAVTVFVGSIYMITFMRVPCSDDNSFEWEIESIR